MVNETYRSALGDYDTKDLRRRTLAILNQYYVYCGEHHPAHVSLLMPLLVTYDGMPLETSVFVSMLRRFVTEFIPGGPMRATWVFRPIQSTVPLAT